MISKEVLKDSIECLVVIVRDTNTKKTGIDILADNEEYIFSFAIRCMNIADTIAITFGGYGTYLEIYEVDVTGVNEIVENFIDYIKGFEMTLDDCTIEHEVEIL